MQASSELPPQKPKPGRPAFNWHGEFEKARRLSGKRRRWVKVRTWGSWASPALVRRSVISGVIEVEGGGDAWDLEVRPDGEDGDYALWVRPRAVTT